MSKSDELEDRISKIKEAEELLKRNKELKEELETLKNQSLHTLNKGKNPLADEIKSRRVKRRILDAHSTAGKLQLEIDERLKKTGCKEPYYENEKFKKNFFKYRNKWPGVLIASTLLGAVCTFFVYSVIPDNNYRYSRVKAQLEEVNEKKKQVQESLDGKIQEIKAKSSLEIHNINFISSKIKDLADAPEKIEYLSKYFKSEISELDSLIMDYQKKIESPTDKNFVDSYKSVISELKKKRSNLMKTYKIISDTELKND